MRVECLLGVHVEGTKVAGHIGETLSTLRVNVVVRVKQVGWQTDRSFFLQNSCAPLRGERGEVLL